MLNTPQHVAFTIHEKCPYSEFFWYLFSRIQIEYGEILRISPYLVWMQENMYQKNSEYGHFLRSVTFGDKRSWYKKLLIWGHM